MAGVVLAANPHADAATTSTARRDTISVSGGNFLTTRQRKSAEPCSHARDMAPHQHTNTPTLQRHRLTHAGNRTYMRLYPATTSANKMLRAAQHYIGTMADDPCYRKPQTLLGGAAISP
jgi:hypothetical protein